jgi:hypothetical protein
MVKLVCEIPEGLGYVRQVWEGETVAESFILLGMAGNHFEKAIHERNMEISRLLTNEVRVLAKEKRVNNQIMKTKKVIDSLVEEKDAEKEVE